MPNTNHRRLNTPRMAAPLRMPDLVAGAAGDSAPGERDDDWDEFLAIALPGDPLDHPPGTAWSRTPVLLSY